MDKEGIKALSIDSKVHIIIFILKSLLCYYNSLKSAVLSAIQPCFFFFISVEETKNTPPILHIHLDL